MKTSSEDEDEKRLLKTKTKDVFKSSSRRLHQDECLVGEVAHVILMYKFYFLKFYMEKIFCSRKCWGVPALLSLPAILCNKSDLIMNLDSTE